MNVSSLLSKLLQKRGIEKIEDLAPEEKVVFDRWNATLKGETVTIETLKDFCKAQVRLLEEKVGSDAEFKFTPYLSACLHVYLNILKAIEAPESEREAIERHITQLINS